MFLVSLLDGPLQGVVSVPKLLHYHFFPLSSGNFAFYYMVHRNAKPKEESEADSLDAIRAFNSSRGLSTRGKLGGAKAKKKPKQKETQATYKWFSRTEFAPDHQDVVLYLKRREEEKDGAKHGHIS